MKIPLAAVVLAFLAVLPARAQKPVREPVARDLIEMMGKEEFPGAVSLFDAKMREVMPADTLRDLWAGLTAKAGRFEYPGPARAESAGGSGSQTVRVLCVFEKGAFAAKVGVDGEGRISGLSFLPAAAPSLEEELRPMPALFQERSATVGTGEWALPGTLTMPAVSGPVPAVVLVHGAGPYDRDERVGPNRPFRDLAWGLASRGIAVLRYEKRTKEHARLLDPMKDRITANEETVDDALAAVKLLRGIGGINSKKIFVLGHGLGGMLAPRIASRDPGIAGLIILAGMSRPLEDVILGQMTYILSLNEGEAFAGDKAQLERIKGQAARVKDRSLSEKVPPTELPLGIPASYWLDLRGYNPPETAKKLNRPVLILQGGRDYQATAGDFEGWKKALGSRANAQLRWYPRLNHQFVSGEGMSTPEEYLQRRRTVEGPVLDEIASWVGKQ
ncbi:MAG: alpha/beta fold hydrolase [Chlamydiota bacterium]